VREALLYQDQHVKITMPEKGAGKGELVVSPVKDASSLEELSVEEALAVFKAASFASAALFEALKAEGTNIVLDEASGVKARVFARFQGDNLGLSWTSQKPSREAEDVFKRVKDLADIYGLEPLVEHSGKGGGEAEKDEPKPEPAGEREDYLVKHLRRLP